jgi:hypothetical protein
MSNTGIVNIRGKEYQTVALRVQKFREQHPDWSIITALVSRDSETVVMLASVTNEQGRIIATGHAEEFRSASQINATSALENCETSAIGRALAAAGFGGTEFASANEVQNAIHQQSNPEKFVKMIEESNDVESLKTNFKTAFAALQRSPEALALVNKAKDKRKSELAA